MKNDFIALVNQIDDVRKLAHEEHVRGFFESDFVIYDVPEFIGWKQKVFLELQKINKQDAFINNVVTIIDKFEGYTDKKQFDELSGALRAIADNLDYYYEGDSDMSAEAKPKMIFISHSSKDVGYIAAFVELLEALGLRDDEIVCSSIPPYCIPLNGKVYEWLVDKFQNCELHVMYMLSHNYYNSAASLNEMGAAWAMKQKWSAILLPGFGFGEISGCIDPSQIGIKLDDSDITMLKYRLGEFKEMLTAEFGLRSMSPAIWERKRDDFLNKIMSLSINRESENEPVQEIIKVQDTRKPSEQISMNACIMLAYAADDPNGRILRCTVLSGISISTNKVSFIKTGTAREVAKWTSALDELFNQGYVNCEGRGDVFIVTNAGYVFADQIKEEFKIDTTCDFEEYLHD